MDAYNEFNELLLQETTMDSWYDDGFIIAQKIMDSFSKKDWEKLDTNIKNYSLICKKKLLYCIPNRSLVEEIYLVLQLIYDKNEEVFEMCIDSLRSFDKEILLLILKEYPEVVKYIENNKSQGSIITKQVTDDFFSIVESQKSYR